MLALRNHDSMMFQHVACILKSSGRDVEGRSCQKNEISRKEGGTKQKGDKRKRCREKEFVEKTGNRSYENEVPKEKDSQLTDVLTNIV